VELSWCGVVAVPSDAAHHPHQELDASVSGRSVPADERFPGRECRPGLDGFEPRTVSPSMRRLAGFSRTRR
jgi:hypothetical protein